MNKTIEIEQVEINCGGFRTQATQESLDALKPQIAAMWTQITDPRDDAGTHRWYISRAALKAIPCPAYGVTTDILVDYVHQMQVGPECVTTGWHLWTHKSNYGRILGERV